ncbi:MAG: hypothetical protein V4472_09230 [Pseudomonadota bacterium]
MDRKTLNRVGLAAAILLVPGGFILGATLAARRYRQRQASAAASDAEATHPGAAEDTPA